MRRVLITVVLAVLATGVAAQGVQSPEAAGAYIESEIGTLWPLMRSAMRDWYNDPGDGSVHPDHVGPVGEFPQCVWRYSMAEMVVVSRGDTSLDGIIPPNLNDAPTDRDEVSCKLIFRAYVSGMDETPTAKKFSFLTNVYEVPESHPGWPGSYDGKGWDLLACFAWDDEPDEVPDEVWCRIQGDPLDPENRNADWHHVLNWPEGE